MLEYDTLTLNRIDFDRMKAENGYIIDSLSRRAKYRKEVEFCLTRKPRNDLPADEVFAVMRDPDISGPPVICKYIFHYGEPRGRWDTYYQGITDKKKWVERALEELEQYVF